LFITPDVAESDFIRRIEVPGILQRATAVDEYFVVPVCAGGLDYASAARVVDARLSAEDFRNWNLMKVEADPITVPEAAAVARRVLKRRIAAVHRQLEPTAPLRVGLYTRKRPGFQPGVALCLDWCVRFNGREAPVETWNGLLLPALTAVQDAVRTEGGGRPVVASGLASIPAATALGAAFLAQGGLKLGWSQFTPGRPEQLWSLDAPREPTGFCGRTRDHTIAAADLAVLVSVTDDVEPAFAQTPQKVLPPFRAITRIAKTDCKRFDITSPGQAVDIAMTVAEAIRDARRGFRPLSVVHLFMAVPIGLAVLIGQSLNTLGPVQTYEHVSIDGTGIYRAAARLTPSE
jgi:hypothetical protein